MIPLKEYLLFSNTKYERRIRVAKLTYETWDSQTEDFLIENDSKGALQALEWAYEEYDDLVYACSFGIEGIVMIDLISTN